MGEPVRGETVQTFVGVSKAIDKRGESEGTLDVAKLSEALQSAAEQAIDAGLVGPDQTLWVRLSFLDVELANQHPKTVRIGVTPLGS
jgi:hypothetical protein